MTFAECLAREPLTLTEGAVIERLRRDPAALLDPHVLHAGFVYSDVGRRQLERVCRSYLEIAVESRLPFVIGTPTWRASPERLSAAGLGSVEQVNADGVRFAADLRATCGEARRHIFIAGLMGCRGDAYDPRQTLSVADARVYHAPQARALAQAGVDCLLAATLPALAEALGLAAALGETEVPYVLSFVLRPDGCLLDDTPLHEAVSRIDSGATPRPLAYWANCVHPAVFRQAMERDVTHDPGLATRIVGLQANTSPLGPAELDHSGDLRGAEPAEFAADLCAVQRRFGLRVLGGCCGTDDRHIRALAGRYRGGPAAADC